MIYSSHGFHNGYIAILPMSSFSPFSPLFVFAYGC